VTLLFESRHPGGAPSSPFSATRCQPFERVYGFFDASVFLLQLFEYLEDVHPCRIAQFRRAAAFLELIAFWNP
jgi:hypothetical protein